MSDVLREPRNDDVTYAVVPWRDRIYSASRVTELLRTYRLSEHLTAAVDYAFSDQLALCREMMADAALTGSHKRDIIFPKYRQVNAVVTRSFFNIVRRLINVSMIGTN